MPANNEAQAQSIPSYPTSVPQASSVDGSAVAPAHAPSQAATWEPPVGQANQAGYVAPNATLPPNPTVRPVSLGEGAPYASPSGMGSDMEALSAYKTLEARKKRRRRKRIIVGCILGAVALGALGWFAWPYLQPVQPDDGTSIDVGYALVETYENSVSASGAIKPASQVVVTPEVEGIIEKVQVAEGDNVAKGDVLFTIRNNTLDKLVQEKEQGVKTAENTVTSAENAVQTASAALAQAQSTYDRVFSTGYETQEEADAAGLEASEGLNNAQTGLEEAELALENARLAVTTAKEELEEARNNAEKRTVVAPEGGAIVTMQAVEGALVGAGEGSSGSSNSLVTIADLSTLRVSVQVNEVDINNLKEGQKAEVTFSALPDVVLEASIDRIASVSSGEGSDDMYGGGGIVTYDVDMVILNPDPQVKPGMTARVKILTERIDNALTVPLAAVQLYSEDEGTVNVAPGYTGEGTPQFEEREVRIVAKDSMTAVIEGDISDGDAVQLFYDEMAMDDASMDY